MVALPPRPICRLPGTTSELCTPATARMPLLWNADGPAPALGLGELPGAAIWRPTLRTVLSPSLSVADRRTTSVPEARVSVRLARTVFTLSSEPDRLRVEPLA